MSGLVASLKPIDDVDSRLEITLLLQHLPSRERTAFLYHCCDKIGVLGVDPETHKPIVVTITNESGEVAESYSDLMGLIGIYGLDANEATKELERRVRKFTSPGGLILPRQ